MKKLQFILFVFTLIPLFSAETTTVLTVFPAVYAKKFDHDIKGWSSPAYWGGKAAWDPEGFLRLIPTNMYGRIYGRIFKDWGTDISLTGSIFDYSAQVKGRGKMRFGVFVFGYDSRGKNTIRQLWDHWNDLTDTWKNIKFRLDLSNVSPRRISLVMETDSNGELCVKSVELKPLRDPSLLITPSSEYAAARGKGILPEVSFHLSKPFAEAILFLPNAPASPVPVLVKADSQGKIVSSAGKGSGNFLRIASHGNNTSVIIENLAPEEYDTFNELAGKVKTKKTVNILVIGDSLLDKNFRLNRGIGSINQVAFWLNLHNSGKFNIRNVAVRGDHIERVWNRMCFELKKREKAEFSQKVYQGLFQYPADLIFIQLGHNDTKSPSTWNYSKPFISPEQQKQLYRKVLSKIRKAWPESRIILVSSTTGNYPRTKQISEYFAKKFPKKRYDLFCIPEFMERFNAVLQEIAPEFNAEWYDIYTPLKAMAQEERAKLFDVNDGVHLSPAGQKYLTRQYLIMIGNTLSR